MRLCREKLCRLVANASFKKSLGGGARADHPRIGGQPDQERMHPLQTAPSGYTGVARRVGLNLCY